MPTGGMWMRLCWHWCPQGLNEDVEPREQSVAGAETGSRATGSGGIGSFPRWVQPRRCTSPRTPATDRWREWSPRAAPQLDRVRGGDGQHADLTTGPGRRSRTRPTGFWRTRPTPRSRSATRCVLAGSRPSKANEITGRAHRGSNGGRPPAFDKAAYMTRNVVERTINKPDQTRAVATRYDKREFLYRGKLPTWPLNCDPPE